MAIQQYSPTRTVVTSFSAPSRGSLGGNGSSSFEYDGGVYITILASPYTNCADASVSPTSCPISCALSDRSILTYNAEVMKLEHTIPEAHSQPISHVHYLPSPGNASASQAPSMIASSGQDGYIRIFDLRSRATSGSSATLSMSMAGRDQTLSLACGFGGTLLAAGGSSGSIYFYDLRKAGQHLGSYENSHTEEVTQLQFQSSSSSLLVSGGEDGLICAFDTSKATEDAALKSVLNVSNSVRSLGFFGPSLEGIFCCTGSETLSCWHTESAQQLSDYGGHGVRPHLTSQLQTHFKVENHTSMTLPQSQKTVDYMVGCAWEKDVMMTDIIGQPPQAGRLTLVTGTNDGDVALFTTNANSITLQRSLVGGHKGVIRGFEVIPRAHTSSQEPLIITGGEDARLCQWDLSEESNGTSNVTSKSGTTATISPGSARVRPSLQLSPTRPGGGPTKRQHSKKKLPLAPY
jgi:WD40 repeat protein